MLEIELPCVGLVRDHRLAAKDAAMSIYEAIRKPVELRIDDLRSQPEV